MKRLLFFFVDLCLLKRGPQDLPPAWLLFGLLLPVNLLVGSLLIGDSLGGLDRAFLAALVDLAVLLGWTRLLLLFKRHPERYLQTVTSLLGMGVLLGLLAMPMQFSLAGVESGADLDGLGQLLSLLLLFVMIWSLVVTGHIFRHALDISLGLGMGLALTYSVLTTVAIAALIPDGKL